MKICLKSGRICEFLGRLAYIGAFRGWSGSGFLLVGQLEHVDVLEVNFAARGLLRGDQVLFGQDLNTSLQSVEHKFDPSGGD